MVEAVPEVVTTARVAAALAKAEAVLILMALVAAVVVASGKTVMA